MAQLSQREIEAQALSLIKREKGQWEDATAFITERVAFQMRNLIRQLRKNYWGVFDVPLDPQTQRKKIWIPLTESTVEAAVKNIDLDTKDINFRAKHPSAIGFVKIIRSVVHDKLSEMGFGEILDMMERQLAIDGTVVWKTTEEFDPELGEKVVKLRWVDLLNFYIDPVAESIAKAPSVIERAVLTPMEFASHDEWMNKDEVMFTKDIVPFDDFQLQSFHNRGEVKFIQVFERWGQMPKSLITGNDEDKDTMVEGIIVASNIDNAAVLHRLVLNPKGIKPYEEAWYTRVPNRWYGKGIAEKLIMLQLWINTIVNIRINRSYVAQLGIFKIRNGSGITPQMIGRLASNGAILVNNMEDIQQLAMQEASIASYQDENVIQGWAQQVTSAFEVVTGEALPATTSATAVAVQTGRAQSQFVLIKEGIGQFLQRWMKRHALPIIMKNLKRGYLLRLEESPDDLREIAEFLVNKAITEQVEKMKKKGLIIDPQQFLLERTRAINALLSKKEVFVEILKDIDWTKVDVQVFITNEEFDKGVMVQNLLIALQNAPEFRDQIIRQVFDLMGVNLPRNIQPQQQTAPTQVNPATPPLETPQGQITRGRTLAPQARPTPAAEVVA